MHYIGSYWYTIQYIGGLSQSIEENPFSTSQHDLTLWLFKSLLWKVTHL